MTSAGPSRQGAAVEAILLVGGRGTRLRPLTVTTPKPLLPAAGVPFLTHQLARARAAGVEHVILSTSYLAETFEAHFGDGSALGLEIEYVVEPEPLGTGGGIRNAADRVRSADVLVFNTDVLTGLDLGALMATHRATGADVTLHLTRVTDPRAFGLVPTDAEGRVTAFLEKPMTRREIVTQQVNAGCYVFTAAALRSIPAGRPVSVERETFPTLLAQGARLTGHVDQTYWLDVGTPAAFITGSCDLVTGIAPSPAVQATPGPALVLAGAEVAVDANLSGGTTVGAGARVGPGARVKASVLFDGAIVEEGASVRRSVLGRDARVGPGTVLDGVVLADGARIGAGNELRSGVRVWPGVEIPDGAVRFSSDR